MQCLGETTEALVEAAVVGVQKAAVGGVRVVKAAVELVAASLLAQLLDQVLPQVPVTAPQQVQVMEGVTHMWGQLLVEVIN